jgi:predicted ATPase
MAIVYHLKVQNFRGIKSLDWHVDNRVICLVGPGDSAKTTILNAIEMALLSRWNVPFTDTDFYQSNTGEELVIKATVGDLPDALIKQEKYGLYLRGYSIRERAIHDDPADEDEQVLTIRLTVDSSLEPQWAVVKDSNPDPRSISWRDRGIFGAALLGDDVDRTLTWSRGSALAKLTDSESSAQIIAVANRKACEAVGKMELDEWQQVADQAKAMAREYGVPINDLQPGLDVRAIRFGQGVLSLYDGSVPLQFFGLGSKRLAALAVQEAGIGKASIILIDEVEHGLEPHRIRRLVKKLCDNRNEGQVIMTSHSPTSVVTLPVHNLRFTRYKNGHLDVLACDEDAQTLLQPVLRRCPLAIFARQVIVCEGKTEEALCGVLNLAWAACHEGENFELHGIVAVNGGGTSAPEAARQLTKLGYKTVLFGDSDITINPTEQELRTAGAEVFLWDGNMATEQRIATDVPLTALQEILNLGCKIKGEQGCVDSCKTELAKLGGDSAAVTSTNIVEWQEKDIDEPTLRKVIGNAAKVSKWFKNLNEGRRLAVSVVEALPHIKDTPLARTLRALEAWVYAE